MYLLCYNLDEDEEIGLVLKANDELSYEELKEIKDRKIEGTYVDLSNNNEIPEFTNKDGLDLFIINGNLVYKQKEEI